VPTGIDTHVFRDVIGRFATGVTVVTTRADGADFGTTASAVSSLSAEPPMLLICLNETSETRRAIVISARFAVNILSAKQTELAGRFATKHPSKFQPADIERAPSGLPLIAGSLAVLECRVTETIRGGTHTVFLAEVETARAMEGDPLAYYRGRFGRFEDALHMAAYRLLRGFVLRREVGLDEPLEVHRLSEDLDMQEAHIHYGLTRLETEGLVERRPGRGFVVKPLRARDADEALQTRALIEGGIARTVAGNLEEPALAELRALAREACDSVASPEVDYRRLSLASRAFHTKFVSLAGNQLLDDLYAQLRIDAIWLKVLWRQNGSRYVDPSYLALLVDACEAGDAPAAQRIVNEHADEARRIARQAIEHAGGLV
jgi:flavin reductase (DIM6/NTAB) family NADH-FMN oxidoreductase RutF/DNA-binding FadR family transcriptional regulator